MHYKRELELVFDLASIPSKQTPQLPTLRYIAATTTSSSTPCPPEKEFFLHHLRARLPAAAAHSPQRLLSTVAAAWDKAEAVSEHVRRLDLSFPTAVAAAAGDGGGGSAVGAGVAVTASVLLVPLQTRVEVVLTLDVVGGSDGALEVSVTPAARVVYGEQFNVGKMEEFLRSRVGGVGGGQMGWDEAVLELYGRLLAKGKQRG